MTLGDWAFTLVTGELVVAGLAFWLISHVRWHDGYEAGRLDERALHHQRTLNGRREPTRLVSRPYVGQHAPWQPRYTVTRSATIAFAGGPATVPISHRTDSGELRALVAGTDRYVEDMRRSEAAYRRQLTS